MTKKDKFYRTVVTIEILSRSSRPPKISSISDLSWEILEGGWSGDWDVTDQDEVTPQEMAKMLMKQSSSPEFLGLLEDGSTDPDWGYGDNR